MVITELIKKYLRLFKYLCTSVQQLSCVHIFSVQGEHQHSWLRGDHQFTFILIDFKTIFEVNIYALLYTILIPTCYIYCSLGKCGGSDYAILKDRSR